MNTLDSHLHPELLNLCEDASNLQHRMEMMGHKSWVMAGLCTRDHAEELEEAKKDYACLARELDGHDATECLFNLRRLKEESARYNALIRSL